MADLGPSQPLTGERRLDLRLTVALTGEARCHPGRVLREIALGGVFHVPERHVRRGVAEELLKPHNRHAGLRAVHAEGVA